MTKVRRMCRQQSDSASSLGGAEGNHRAKGAAALNGRTPSPIQEEGAEGLMDAGPALPPGMCQ